MRNIPFILESCTMNYGVITNEIIIHLLTQHLSSQFSAFETIHEFIHVVSLGKLFI